MSWRDAPDSRDIFEMPRCRVPWSILHNGKIRAVLVGTPRKPKWRTNYRKTSLFDLAVLYLLAYARTRTLLRLMRALHVYIHLPQCHRLGRQRRAIVSAPPSPSQPASTAAPPAKTTISELPVPVFEQSNAEVFRVTFYEYRVIPTIMLISTNR